jgi:prepilin-type N-terminal cleavage/methylation domain-containing protein
MQHIAKGFTFIEIITSLLLLCILLMGADAFQLETLRSVKANFYAFLANNQLINLVEKCHASRQLSMNDIEVWNQQNKTLLPNGVGEVHGQCPQMKLTIFWGKISSKQCDKIRLGESGCLTQWVK